MMSASTTRSSVGVAYAPRYVSSMELIHDLYQELEPQITPSYRPHVTYVPPPPGSRDHVSNTRLTASSPHGKAAKLKNVKLAMDVVSEFKKRRESTVKNTLLQAAAAGKKDSPAEKNWDKERNGSQSLPNLTGTTS